MAQPMMTQVGEKRIGVHRGGRPQRYVLDEPTRTLILARYDGTSECIDELTSRLHIPRWRLKRWAIYLGLTKATQREPNWTEAEISYLETNLGRLGFARIARDLGRTKVAVEVKARRIGVNQRSNGYTMRSLCQCLGCDHHKVARWMKQGWLVGHRRETNHTTTRDFWYFSDKEIRDFVIAHPNEIDQRRMDWHWMVQLLSGEVRSLVQDTSSNRPRKDGHTEMHVDIDNHLQFDIDHLAGKGIGILGITRSGKTNTALVLIEELLSNNIPMTIVDIEGEYRGLKERFPLGLVGLSDEESMPLDSTNAGDLACESLEQNVSVLLDLSDYPEDSCHDILLAYFETLWTMATKRKSPYQIVLEEAHEWVPETKRTRLKDVLIRIALRGRKRGLGLMLISQRSAKVSKDALSQCDLHFLHRVIHPADRAVYKSLVPLPGTEVDRMIGDLITGYAIIVGGKIPQVAHIRTHGSKPVQPDVKTLLRKHIKELEEQVSEQEFTIRQQADLIAKMQAAYPELVEALMQEEVLA